MPGLSCTLFLLQRHANLYGIAGMMVIKRVAGRMRSTFGLGAVVCLVLAGPCVAGKTAQDLSPAEAKLIETNSAPPVKGNWRLSFVEDFDDVANALDTKFWTNKDLWDAALGASAFTAGNILVRDGQLHILTRKEPGTDFQGKTYDYTSGLVQSFGKFTQKYGYFEARMTLPTTKGLWPAFWLMPDRKGHGDLANWAAPGRRSTFVEDGAGNGYPGKGMEIDIMEHLTIWGPNKFHFAAHWDGYDAEHKKQEATRSTAPSTDGSRTFGLYWKPDLLVWFVDNREVYRMQSERVADVPMYILLNTSVGGWDGNSPDSTTVLPATTLVDWVRVWTED